MPDMANGCLPVSRPPDGEPRTLLRAGPPPDTADARRGTVRGRPRVAATTLPGCRMIVRRHLVPALGYVPLARLAPQALQGYYSRKLAEGMSGATVRQHHAIVHKALHHAVRRSLIGRNPADLVDAPRAGRFDARVWDEEQTHLFLGEARKTSHYYALYLTAILTGMRQSELFGLRWQDVDLGLGVARVVQSFHRVPGDKQDGRAPQSVFKAPKSESSRRAIALPPAVVDALRQARAEQDEARRMLDADYHDHDLVFAAAGREAGARP